MKSTLIKLAAAGIALSLALAAAGGFGVAWKLQELTITKLELSHAHESLTLELDARAQAEASIATISRATNDKVVRDSRNRAAATAAGNAGYGLRIASAETVKAAQADPSACAQSIAIYDTVLGTMADAGGRISAEADLWESDALMLKARLTQPEAAQ